MSPKNKKGTVTRDALSILIVYVRPHMSFPHVAMYVFRKWREPGFSGQPDNWTVCGATSVEFRADTLVSDPSSSSVTGR
jgi:hypothetical protein